MEFKEFDVKTIGIKHDIRAVVYGNDEESFMFVLPHNLINTTPHIIFPTQNEWNEIIKQSDILEVEVIKDDPNKKIVLRKSTRQIDLNISWEVFRRDDYKCRYCGNNHVPLTVDHVVLWEEGGPTIPLNLITSCKRCNNLRGNMKYEDWLKSPEYNRVNISLSQYEKNLNETIILDIPIIMKDHMRIHKRNR